jgi:hypothetical protein
MGAPFHGYNALIYVSATDLVGGNAWNLNIDTDSIVTNQFGDTWKKRTVGQNDWSGSITAWDQGDEKLLATAATAQASVAILIYPDRSDTGDYYSGNAIFGMRSAGGVTAAVSKDGDFVGNDTLTITGFS